MDYSKKNEFLLNYGNATIPLIIPPGISFDYIRPPTLKYSTFHPIDFSKQKLIENKLIKLRKLADEVTVGICVNDKTRPVPYDKMLPNLLDYLYKLKIQKNNIKFFIANGTHIPVDISNLDYLPDYVKSEFVFINHDSENKTNVLNIGKTSRGTPVNINKKFMECDIKISLGNIEPHHFAGYSGGAKSVAIGLANRETIITNHKMLVLNEACACNYDSNPLRQDIEEIGKLVGLDFCLNSVKDVDKNIIKLFWGTPEQVMRDAIKVVDHLFVKKVEKKYDLVIASAGGYPKDINLYQAQKAITNAAQITKNKGTVILVARCVEGVGSTSYQQYMKKFSSPEQIVSEYENGFFEIGPHKALQFAFIQMRINIGVVSEIEENLVRDLLLSPINDLNLFIKNKLIENPNLEIAVMPDAVVTIPRLEEGVRVWKI